MKHWKRMSRVELENFIVAMGVNYYEKWTQALSLEDYAHFCVVIDGANSMGDVVEAEFNGLWAEEMK